MLAKAYQERVLETVDRFSLAFAEECANAAEIEQLRTEKPTLPIAPLDPGRAAWNRLVAEGVITPRKDKHGAVLPYSPRETGMGAPTAAITLKVPTGGGKTYLAVQSVIRLAERLFTSGAPRLVVWIMPSEAIYSQTKAALIDRNHPYRKMLDVAYGGRVKILEKNTAVHRADLDSHLCILLLQLASVARENGVDALRTRRDRGDLNGFLPEATDRPAHEALKRSMPNLEGIGFEEVAEGADNEPSIGMVKNSLMNAIRMARPIIVLDEGHKGVPPIAYRTIYDMNPRTVVELTATPKDARERWANCLVQVTGLELRDEQMIKLPMIVRAAETDDRLAALSEAWQTVEALQAEADQHRNSGGDYIRPILLVQVERTGKEQLEAAYVHSEHVKEWLLAKGVPEDAIAVKTADQNDLKGISNPELLDPKCPVRVIITKQALQEGWDCSFAYVLCTLAAGRSPSAMTQLVGRILRQPFAKWTGVPNLDQCYVFTDRADTAKVVENIKQGLEGEGMADLTGMIRESSTAAASLRVRERREPLSKRAYYLPEVLVEEHDKTLRHLDWESDILGHIDWSEMSVEPDADALNKTQAEKYDRALAINFDATSHIAADVLATAAALPEFDLAFAVRRVTDVVPNPFQAYRIVIAYLEAFRAAGWSKEEMAACQKYVTNGLLARLSLAVDSLAKQCFEDGLASGRIRFQLSAEPWWTVPQQDSVEVTEQTRWLTRDMGASLEQCLWEWEIDAAFNNLERPVALFLDRDEAVTWWYRNAVRGGAYGLQGWRKSRIYPDFIIAQEKDGELERWLVLETKGTHLYDSPESEYKRNVMQTLTEAYEGQNGQPVGQLKLFEKQAEYVVEMVVEGKWQEQVSGLLAPGG